MPPAVDGSLTASRDGAVLRLTLDRPSRHNSLTPSMIAAFVDALTNAATDDSLRVIHIRGAGDDFCSGVDWVATNSGDHKPRTGDILRRIPHAREPSDRAGARRPPARRLQCAGIRGRTGLQSRAGGRLHRGRRRRGVLGAVRRPGIQPGFGCHLAASPVGRCRAREADVVARRQSQRGRCRRLGFDLSAPWPRPTWTAPPTSC